MKSKIALYVLLAAMLFTCTTFSAMAAEGDVGEVPAIRDTSGAMIVSPSIEQLLEPGADIEALLYPSGLKLPTKYIDLLQFAPVNSTKAIADEAIYLLKTAAPVESNTYTNAEYMAAQYYLNLARLYFDESRATEHTHAALVNLDADTSLNMCKNLSDAKLTNSEHLRILISNYSNVLLAYAIGTDVTSDPQYVDMLNEHDGVYYSFGGPNGLDLSYFASSRTDEAVETFIDMLDALWKLLSVEQSYTPAQVEYSESTDSFAYNGVNFKKGAPDTFGRTRPTASFGEDSSSAPADNRDITPVVTVEGNVNPDDIPHGKMNFREIMSILAFAFMVVAVIVLWIIKVIRRKKDPLYTGWK